MLLPPMQEAGGGDGFGDDMTEAGGRGVWLLGEQRWERSKSPKA